MHVFKINLKILGAKSLLNTQCEEPTRMGVFIVSVQFLLVQISVFEKEVGRADCHMNNLLSGKQEM